MMKSFDGSERCGGKPGEPWVWLNGSWWHPGDTQGRGNQCKGCDSCDPRKPQVAPLFSATELAEAVRFEAAQYNLAAKSPYKLPNTIEGYQKQRAILESAAAYILASAEGLKGIATFTKHIAIGYDAAGNAREDLRNLTSEAKIAIQILTKHLRRE